MLSQLLAIVGAGAGLVGWVAVVGAAREYARFTAAGIPSPAETASLFPNGALIGEGIIALLLPLLVGLAVALLTYVGLRFRLGDAGRSFDVRAAGRGRKTDSRVTRDLLLGAIAGIAIGGLVIAVVLGLRAGVPLLLVTAVLAFVVWSGWLTTPTAVAVLVFSGLAVVAGLSEYWKQATEAAPKFDSAIVTRRGGREPVAGFYITRSGGNVYLAVRPEAHSIDSHQFAVLSIPDDEVDAITLGPGYGLKQGALVTGPRPGVPMTTVPTPKGPDVRFLRPLVTSTPAPTSSPGPAVTTTPGPGPTGTPGPTVTTTPLPGPSPRAPSIRFFALDEIIPAHGAFRFPLGAGRVGETISVTITARLARRPVLLRTRGIHLAPHERVVLNVHLGTAVTRRLRHNAVVYVDVAATATAGLAATNASYSLYLQTPCRRTKRGRICAHQE